MKVSQYEGLYVCAQNAMDITKREKKMFRYYFIDVVASDGDNLYKSAILTKEEMLHLVELFSKEFTDIEFSINVKVVNRKEEIWWKKWKDN